LWHSVQAEFFQEAVVTKSTRHFWHDFTFHLLKRRKVFSTGVVRR
jgi:hypothetical protein